jgi:hypothetical protein
MCEDIHHLFKKRQQIDKKRNKNDPETEDQVQNDNEMRKPLSLGNSMIRCAVDKNKTKLSVDT